MQFWETGWSLVVKVRQLNINFKISDEKPKRAKLSQPTKETETTRIVFEGRELKRTIST